jgi:hypothetical protein
MVFCGFGQLHFVELCHHVIRLVERGFPVLLRMDRLEHGSDGFEFRRWNFLPWVTVVVDRPFLSNGWWHVTYAQAHGMVTLIAAEPEVSQNAPQPRYFFEVEPSCNSTPLRDAKKRPRLDAASFVMRN